MLTLPTYAIAALAAMPHGPALRAKIAGLRRDAAATADITVDRDVTRFIDELADTARTGPPASTLTVLTNAVRRGDLSAVLTEDLVRHQAVALLTAHGVDTTALGEAPVPVHRENLIQSGARR